MERRKNEEEFPREYKPGLVESIWWTLCVMITLACENKTPKSIPGRLVATVWMVTGVLMISLLTASFSSSLTVSSLSGQINGPTDLQGRREKVATVSGSTAERWLIDHQIHVQGYPTAAEAMSAVASEEAIAAVYDEPILRYLLNKSSHKNLHLVGDMFEKQGYGFGLQLGSTYHKKVNQALLKLIENKTIEELNKKWFGEIADEKKEAR
jgi:ABC-type amino acid transport substrate-binding protein